MEPTQRYIPEGAEEIRKDGLDAVVYLYTNKYNGHPGAVAYTGKRNKPNFNNFYTSEDRRQKSIDNFFYELARMQADRDARKAAKKVLRAALVNPFEVGDILVYSWGWEQTNVDWFQVVKVNPRSVVIREIAGTIESSEGLSSMSGYGLPQPDQFIADSDATIKMLDPRNPTSLDMPHGVARKWDGSKQYVSWYA